MGIGFGSEDPMGIRFSSEELSSLNISFSFALY